MRLTGAFLFPLAIVAGTLAAARPVAAQGATTFGGGADVKADATSANANGNAEATPPANTERELLQEGVTGEKAAPQEGEKEREWKEREAKLNEAATLTGGVGLLHTQHAAGGAAGQFRVGFTTEY